MIEPRSGDGVRPSPPRTLAAMEASTERKRVYFVACGLLAAIGTLLLPFAETPLPAVPQFNVFYVTVVIIDDLGTAYLLFGQFRASGRAPLIVLASAYLFTASLVIPHLLYFSEFAPRAGWFRERPQTAAWLWHIWHLAFPLAVLGYVVVERRASAVVLRRRGWIVAAAVAGVVASALLATLLVTRFEARLPELHDGRTWNPITFQLGWAMGLSTVAALVAVLWIARRGRVLHLWLSVALTAFLFDIVPNMLALERFAFGWYFGRVSGLLAAGFLFAMLLREINRLHVSLSGALDEVGRLNRELEGRVAERTRALRDANASLEAAVAERDILLSEVYHRVNNNLQTMSALLLMERRRFDDPEARRSLDRMARRARAMGLVHQQLMGARELHDLDLSALLKELGANLREALGLEGRGVTLEVRADNLRGDLDVAVPLGLVVNELVSNAAEHAFPEGREGSIDVSLRQDGADWRLEVADDGAGLGPAPPGLGLRILERLATQLDGEFEYCTGPGARGVLTFPRPRG